MTKYVTPDLVTYQTLRRPSETGPKILVTHIMQPHPRFVDDSAGLHSTVEEPRFPKSEFPEFIFSSPDSPFVLSDSYERDAVIIYFILSYINARSASTLLLDRHPWITTLVIRT